MTKLGTKLSDEHKQHIGEATKRMWESGKFDSPKTRKIWRKTALNGIAKKGRPGPNKRIPSQEMLDDLSKMGDRDFMQKWNVSRIVPIKLRKRYGIESFNKQHGTKEHKIENGVEYKWCQKEHWEPVSNFGKNRSRWDGLRGWCKGCEQEKNQEYYDKNDGAKRARDWRKTESGKKSQSLIMLRSWRRRKSYYIKFEPEDEEKVYKLCKEKCAYCGTLIPLSEIEFDHFIPIKLDGKTAPSNMLPVCGNCNRGRGGKFDKHPHDWLLKRFGPIYGEKIYNRCVKILSSLKP